MFHDHDFPPSSLQPNPTAAATATDPFSARTSWMSTPGSSTPCQLSPRSPECHRPPTWTFTHRSSPLLAMDRVSGVALAGFSQWSRSGTRSKALTSSTWAPTMARRAPVRPTTTVPSARTAKLWPSSSGNSPTVMTSPSSRRMTTWRSRSACHLLGPGAKAVTVCPSTMVWPASRSRRPCFVPTSNIEIQPTAPLRHLDPFAPLRRRAGIHPGRFGGHFGRIQDRSRNAFHPPTRRQRAESTALWISNGVTSVGSTARRGTIPQPSRRSKACPPDSPKLLQVSVLAIYSGDQWMANGQSLNTQTMCERSSLE